MVNNRWRGKSYQNDSLGRALLGAVGNLERHDWIGSRLRLPIWSGGEKRRVGVQSLGVVDVVVKGGQGEGVTGSRNSGVVVVGVPKERS
jgi:hypothetical protein